MKKNKTNSLNIVLTILSCIVLVGYRITILVIGDPIVLLATKIGYKNYWGFPFILQLTLREGLWSCRIFIMIQFCFALPRLVNRFKNYKCPAPIGLVFLRFAVIGNLVYTGIIIACVYVDDEVFRFRKIPALVQYFFYPFWTLTGDGTSPYREPWHVPVMLIEEILLWISAAWVIHSPPTHNDCFLRWIFSGSTPALILMVFPRTWHRGDVLNNETYNIRRFSAAMEEDGKIVSTCYTSLSGYAAVMILIYMFDSGYLATAPDGSEGIFEGRGESISFTALLILSILIALTPDASRNAARLRRTLVDYKSARRGAIFNPYNHGCAVKLLDTFDELAENVHPGYARFYNGRSANRKKNGAKMKYWVYGLWLWESVKGKVVREDEEYVVLDDDAVEEGIVEDSNVGNERYRLVRRWDKLK